MKFTLEEGYNGIVEKIKEKEAEPLLNERGIKDLIQDDIDFMTEHNIEVELDAYIKAKLKKFQSMDGNIRKVNKDSIDNAIDKAIEDYKKKNPKPGQKRQTDDEAFESMKQELREEYDLKIKALEDKAISYEAEKNLSLKKTSILSKFKEAGIVDEEWINETLDFSPISTSTDVESYVTKGLKLYNLDSSKPPRNKTPDKTGGKTARNALITAVKNMTGDDKQ